ncbi:Amidohydrolase [Cyclobacterium lianum]|uniref:Amidohydrolase n=2 Tax=Cyclobacterium lianum TaxID=388280 RepID=A0A1M7QBW0_9BACT|nr:Amidohydrolase [Cyclobacterium lianum]
MANPDIRNQDWKSWASAIRPFAETEQVYCKVSGLLTRASRGVGQQELHPYFDTSLEVFGVERLMYGSDWPVLLQAESLER